MGAASLTPVVNTEKEIIDRLMHIAHAYKKDAQALHDAPKGLKDGKRISQQPPQPRHPPAVATGEAQGMVSGQTHVVNRKIVQHGPLNVPLPSGAASDDM